MVEEKAGVKKQNSKKGFEKNEHACIVEGVLGFRIFLPVLYLKVAGQTRKIQSSSKLREVRKGKAEILDKQLGLTGIGFCQRKIATEKVERGKSIMERAAIWKCVCQRTDGLSAKQNGKGAAESSLRKSNQVSKTYCDLP